MYSTKKKEVLLQTVIFAPFINFYIVYWLYKIVIFFTVCQVQKDTKNSKGKQNTVTINGKNKTIQNNGPLINTKINNSINGHQNKNNSKNKKEVVNLNKNGPNNNQFKKNEDYRVKAPSPPQLTSSTAIQINNAINRLSSRQPLPNFSLENIKLPPGITITKVDPAQVSQRKSIQVCNQNIFSTA